MTKVCICREQSTILKCWRMQFTFSRRRKEDLGVWITMPEKFKNNTLMSKIESCSTSFNQRNPRNWLLTGATRQSGTSTTDRIWSSTQKAPARSPTPLKMKSNSLKRFRACTRRWQATPTASQRTEAKWSPCPNSETTCQTTQPPSPYSAPTIGTSRPTQPNSKMWTTHVT